MCGFKRIFQNRSFLPIPLKIIFKRLRLYADLNAVSKSSKEKKMSFLMKFGNTIFWFEGKGSGSGVGAKLLCWKSSTEEAFSSSWSANSLFVPKRLLADLCNYPLRF